MCCTHCSRCGQEWHEDEVPKVVVEAGTPSERKIEACDICDTDEHLVDTIRPVTLES